MDVGRVGGWGGAGGGGVEGGLTFCLYACLYLFSYARMPYWPSGKGIRLECDRPRFDPSHFQCGPFARSSHTRDLKIGTPVAALPGAWH